MLKHMFLPMICLSLMSQNMQGAIITANGSRGRSAIAEAAKGNAVILFHKPTCRYCTYIKPLFTKLAQHPQNKVTFLSIDITGYEQYYKTQYQFSTVPTVVYLKEGRVIKKHGSDNGTVKLATMQSYLQSLL